MKRYKHIFIVFLVIIASTSFAQKFIAQASKNKVAVGETFQITYTLNGNGSGFKAPALFDFDVYGGPNQSQSISIVNGSMSQSNSWSFILAAKKEGKYTIAPASITVGTSKVESNSIVIEVVKGSSGSANQSNSSANPNVSSPTSAENIADNLFIKVIANKTKAYIGEQISVTYKIYTRYQLRGFQDIKYPDLAGFWTQDVPSNKPQIDIGTENVDGVNYYVAELKHSYIFAQQTGKLKIESIEAEPVVRKKANRQPRDIFEQMMGVGYEDAVYKIKSTPLTIEVLPLPEQEKPTDYSGAVGEFSCKIQLSREKLKANDAVNLVITLNGKGNIKLVEAPKINFPDDFEVYDPKITEKISTTGAGVMGSKTFDYLLIPRREGDYKLDKINFSFFDPKQKKYITIPSPELSVHVEKGDVANSNAGIYSAKSKEEVRLLGEDIRYIKTKTSLEERDNYFFGSLYFYVLLLLPFLCFASFILFRRKKSNEQKDVVGLKSKKANKMAKKQLSIAEKCMSAGEKDRFYIEVSKALYDYVSNKFNIPLSELSRENIQHHLLEVRVDSQSVDKLLKVIDACEFAKYAPGDAKENMNSIYTTTVEIITVIENETK